MAINITKWTGASVTLTLGNIRNSSHFQDMGYKADKANPLGIGTNFTYVHGSTKDFSIADLSGVSSATYTFTGQAAFIGAKGSYTYSGGVPALNNDLEIRQTNTIATVAAGTGWVGDSLAVSYTDTTNAYDHKSTITAGAGASISSSTITFTDTDVNFGSTGSATFNVTVTPADDSTVSAASRAKSATWTVKNPVNTITFDKQTVYLNVGSGAGDTPGHVSVTPTLTNTNNQTVYNNKYSVTSTSGEMTLSGSSTSVTSGVSFDITGINGVTGSHSAVVTADDRNTISENVIVVSSIPAFTTASINVGETLALDMSNLAKDTSVTKIDSSDTTKATITDKAVTGVAAGTTNLTWHTSDGAIIKVGTIIVAAAITITLVKKDWESACSDANYGDTIGVIISGGTEGTTFTLSTTFGTLSATTGVKAGDHVVLSLPASPSASDATTAFKITATPAAGAAVTTTFGDTISTFAQEVTLTLS